MVGELKKLPHSKKRPDGSSMTLACFRIAIICQLDFWETKNQEESLKVTDGGDMQKSSIGCFQRNRLSTIG